MACFLMGWLIDRDVIVKCLLRVFLDLLRVSSLSLKIIQEIYTFGVLGRFVYFEIIFIKIFILFFIVKRLNISINGLSLWLINSYFDSPSQQLLTIQGKNCLPSIFNKIKNNLWTSKRITPLIIIDFARIDFSILRK